MSALLYVTGNIWDTWMDIDGGGNQLPQVILVTRNLLDHLSPRGL